MSNVWLISDPHFGHDNIRMFENRPFASVKEMDESLIKEWNSVVKKDDKIFVLGDFSFHNKEKTKAIISRLNGRKFLVMGNHDKERSKSWWLDAGFDEVSEFPIIYKGFYIFSHEPLYVNNNMPYVNIHGHIHGQQYKSDQYYNVSVEQIGYKPISFNEVVKRYTREETQ